VAAVCPEKSLILIIISILLKSLLILEAEEIEGVC
jgi:hypothetical protein